MPHSPFPGMDPYLEAPDLWPDVHNRLMNIFAEQSLSAEEATWLDEYLRAVEVRGE